MRAKFLCATAVLLGLLPSQSFADATVTALTDVNMRSGPGPEHPSIGLIRNRDRVTMIGCIEGSRWCHVRYRGREGWAYSQYLTEPAGNRFVVTERLAPAPIYRVPAPAPIVTYRPPEPVPIMTYRPPAPAPAPIVTYRAPELSAPMLGERGRGNPLDAYASASLPAVVEPPAAIYRYVVANPVDPVYLDGDVAVGATLPPSVDLRPIPDYRYRYVYVDRGPVVVDPATRRIVYIYR